MTEPPPLPPQNRVMILLLGMAVANLAGGVLCFGVTRLSAATPGDVGAKQERHQEKGPQLWLTKKQARSRARKVAPA
jgi:hypothetical protein